MNNLHLEITINNFNIPKKQLDIDKVINVYVYGSHNYGTQTPSSDIDYIIVYEQDIDESDTLSYISGNERLDATLISPKHFQNMLDNHDIRALECFFLNNDWKDESQKFNFKLDLVKLRHSISSASSNSWVKAKKKLIDGEDLIAYKSLFHSLRMLDYGVQIAKFKKIREFKFSQSETLGVYPLNEILYKIKELKTWDNINNEYKNVYNSLKTEFKKLAPKE